MIPTVQTKRARKVHGVRGCGPRRRSGKGSRREIRCGSWENHAEEVVATQRTECGGSGLRLVSMAKRRKKCRKVAKKSDVGCRLRGHWTRILNFM